MLNLENILVSGHQFSEDQYELKSKFILMNSALIIIFLFVGTLTVLLTIREEYIFALYNGAYLIFDLFMIYILRRSQKNYKFILPIFPIVSILLVVVAIIKYPEEQIRITWFLVVIIFSFFLGGRKLGLAITALILCTILGLEYIIDTSLDTYTLTLAIVILLIGTIVVNLYEQRELTTRYKLHEINAKLEEKVKKEIQKRILVYQKSNLELLDSANKLQKQKDAFEHLAHYDMLTGLPNRIFFNDRLKHSIDKAQRDKSKLAILFFDLDNFKEINDSLGHHIGDEVLKVVATRLQKNIRQSDTLARLGGDEFTLLLEDLNDIYKVGEIAQNLIQILSKVMPIKQHELYVSVSIGASIYPVDGENVEVLLRCADSAMYSAKKEGNNLFHFYKHEMTEQAIERVSLETSMRQGLMKNEFVVYYQPIIDANTDILVGMEALLRWQHPKLGLFSPDKFIHIAESSSIIVDIGEKVLDLVAEQLILWKKEGFSPPCVSVNLSVKQLRDKGLTSKIENILEKTHFKEGWLQLEITEGYAMQQFGQSIRVLKRLRKLGVTLAIDDFGTGYSSLSYLKKLPVDRLKIDKTFINDIPGKQEDEALVRAIISMAKSMHLGIVAEGIETKEQEKFLLDAGCHIMQGYLYFKPMKADKILEIFHNSK